MSLSVQDAIAQYHNSSSLSVGGQCGSMHVQPVVAPAAEVWALVRRFDRPQSYKRFVKSCRVVVGCGDVGSVRDVRVVSGLPAGASMERLEVLDELRRVMSFSIMGGDHRLKNYRSTTTVHEGEEAGTAVVVESYVVNVPVGSTEEETRIFADTIVRCNLKALADVAERQVQSTGGLNLGGSAHNFTKTH